MAVVYRRIDFNHTLGDFGLDLAGAAILFHHRDQIGGITRKIVIARIEYLQLEFNAHRQRRRGLEIQYVC